jgi:hypothetical protein
LPMYARLAVALAWVGRSTPVGSIETCSRPRLLAATHHGFTFYVADPVSSIETCSRPRLLAATHHGFTFYVADLVSSIREQAAFALRPTRRGT